MGAGHQSFEDLDVRIRVGFDEVPADPAQGRVLAVEDVQPLCLRLTVHEGDELKRLLLVLRAPRDHQRVEVHEGHVAEARDG